jgi:Flp pilus assembly protein TadD
MRFVTRLLLVVSLSLAVASTAAVLPSLTVADDDNTTALTVEALRIDVLIRGHLARTTCEITYRNSLDRDVDGRFTFPLPPDAEVSDVALYFGDHLRHAVAVERVQARMAYEETVHRRVDPALAEWSASSRAFQFRVYPIPALGTKVVHIAYDQELTAAPYELDLRYGATLPSFDLTLDAEGFVDGDRVDGGRLSLRRSGGKWEAHERGARLDGVVRVTRDETETALLAWSPSDRLWYASAPLRIQSKARAVPPASHVTLLVDASASAIQRDSGKLADFLRTLLARQSAGVRVNVIPFHITVEAARETNAAGLEGVLQAIPALGATNLAEVFDRLPAIIGSSPPDSRIVLVTDGINSLGDSARLARAVAGAAKLGRPIAIVNASPSADDNLLGGIARATGGWSLDLTTTDPAAAAESAMRFPLRATLAPGASAVRDVLPSAVLVTSDLSATVCARSREPLTSLAVVAAGARHDVPARQLSTPAEQDLVRRAWARARLRVLLDSGASPEDVLDHGRRFGQLTPRTSLLVLESWRDYEMYGIPLPDDLRAERDAELSAIQKQERKYRHDEGPETGNPRATTRETPPNGAAWFIRGRVTDPVKTPLPGVTVTLKTGDRPLDVTLTDTEGRFWLTASRAPGSFTIIAELEGVNSVTRSFPRGATKGTVVALTLTASISESITVTGGPSAPDAESSGIVGARPASLARRSETALADKLLAALSSDAPIPADEALAKSSLAERIARIGEVVAKLHSLSSTDDRIRYYLAARSVLGGEKLFQADAALALRDDLPELAVRVLTDLVEAFPDDAPTLRIIGRVLAGWGRGDLARLLFERALELAPHETQTQRELQFLQRRGKDPRIDESAELQVEMMWDSNYTDVDLHVTEPGGEEVYYKHLESRQGGRLHEDITTGYGPETYTLPHMVHGTYQISLTYYAGDVTSFRQQTLVHVIVYVRGERRDFFVTLANQEDRRFVANVTW